MNDPSMTVRELPEDQVDPKTQAYARSTYAVWEVTLKCNLKCIHCGSRAGDARANELTTAECLDLVRQLAEVGVREVSMIGGEAFLRPDWLQIAREIRGQGMRLTMTTGGYGLGPKMAEQMADAGFQAVSVSVDGLEETHDLLRGRPGSWQWCWKALEAIREAGIRPSANTQINRLSAPQLPRLYELLRDAGVRTWQQQMTVPMGEAADRPEMLLQPAELLDVFPLIHHLWQRAIDEETVRIFPGNNVGFFGPYERHLRSHPLFADAEAFAFWVGDRGGVLTLGIEADGTIKADPSLPTDDYAGGNIRERSLRDIVLESEQLTFNDDPDVEHLWGFCQSCEWARLCRGGDTWTAHVFFDRRGNNPYCHHRTLLHAAQGKRERLVQIERAEGVPFDNGIFEIRVESSDAPWRDSERFQLDRVDWPASWLEADPDLVARLAAERERTIQVWRETRLPKAQQCA